MKGSIRFSLGCLILMGTILCGNLVHAEENAADQLAPAPSEGKPATESDSSKEVVIKGESRLKVKMDKPEPEISFDVDEIAVPYVKTEDYVLDVSPTSMSSPMIAITSYLNSSQTASPHIQLFKRPPIMTLRPKYKNKGNLASWRLRITDGLGNVYKDFSGKNNLPEEIVWDGRNAKGEMMDVGTSYSYIFSVVDEASNPTSQMGRPIQLESLLYDENGVAIAKIVADAMFTKKDRRTMLSPKGELYCREISDMVLAKQNYPLALDCFAKDVDAANYYGELIQEYIVARYLVPKEKIKITGNKSRLEKIVFKIR